MTIKMYKPDAVFITHEHSDHVEGRSYWTENLKHTVYA